MTRLDRIRVLVVDDSAFARKVLREVLVATRRASRWWASRATGWTRWRRSPSCSPDVVTLDLVMPDLDGLGVLRALAGSRRAARGGGEQRRRGQRAGVEALQAGAVDLVHKPTALATDRLYELGARAGGEGAHRRRGAGARSRPDGGARARRARPRAAAPDAVRSWW